MPLYEYQCDACGKRFERIQKFSDPVVDTCPACSGVARRLPSSPAIQFKGSGFYITDYARKSGSTGAEDGKAAPSSEASSSGGTGGDKAPASTPSGSSGTKSPADSGGGSGKSGGSGKPGGSADSGGSTGSSSSS